MLSSCFFLSEQEIAFQVAILRLPVPTTQILAYQNSKAGMELGEYTKSNSVEDPQCYPMRDRRPASADIPPSEEKLHPPKQLFYTTKCSWSSDLSSESSILKDTGTGSKLCSLNLGDSGNLTLQPPKCQKVNKTLNWLIISHVGKYG